MKQLAEEMGERGAIAILAGNKDAANLQQRVLGVKEELKSHPSITLVSDGVVLHPETPERSVEALVKMQGKHPSIRGWAMVGGWPLFAKNALRWKPGEVKVVAADALPEELEYLNAGYAQALIAQNCFMWGYKTVEILVDKIVRNQNPASVVNHMPLTLVKKESADMWFLNWKKWLIKEAVSR
jgi:ribose transport system substrate-binding protein